jgi:hypothetical protein
MTARMDVGAHLFGNARPIPRINVREKIRKTTFACAKVIAEIRKRRTLASG